MTSVGSDRNTDIPVCKHCGKYHGEECRAKIGGCFQYGSFEHRIKECPHKLELGSEQVSKPATTVQKGKKSKYGSNSKVNRNK